MPDKEQATTDDAQTAASCLNILCGPLSRAIVDELVKRGLVVRIDRNALTDSHAEVDRLKGIISRMETEAREAREGAVLYRKQAEKMLSKIEMLQTQVADERCLRKETQ